MVTQNETYTGSSIPCSLDILDDLPITDQLALEFFATARCASFKQAARGLNVPAVLLRKRMEKLEEHLGAPVFVYKCNKLVLTRTGQKLRDHLSQSFGREALVKSKRSMNPTFKVTTCPRRGASYFSTCGT